LRKANEAKQLFDEKNDMQQTKSKNTNNLENKAPKSKINNEDT